MEFWFGLLKKILALCLLPGLCTALFSVITFILSLIKNKIPLWRLQNIRALFKEIICSLFWIYCHIGFRVKHLFKTYSITPYFESSFENPPIILIHGYCDTPQAFWWLTKRLQASIQNPIYTPFLKRMWCSIHVLAENLKLELQNLGDQPRILMGHSMGGIVAAYYTEHLAPSNTITKVITIASPLQGTYWAKFAFGENAKEVQLDSPFLASLRERMQKNIFTHYFHVGSTHDNVICPWHSALMDMDKTKSENNRIIQNAGHATTLYSDDCIKATLASLKSSEHKQ